MMEEVTLRFIEWSNSLVSGEKKVKNFDGSPEQVDFSKIQLDDTFDFSDVSLSFEQLVFIYDKTSGVLATVQNYLAYSGWFAATRPRGLDQVDLSRQPITSNTLKLIFNLIRHGHNNFHGINFEQVAWNFHDFSYDKQDLLKQKWQVLSFEGAKMSTQQVGQLLFDPRSSAYAVRRVHEHICRQGLGFMAKHLVLTPAQLHTLYHVLHEGGHSLEPLEQARLHGRLETLDEFRVMHALDFIKDEPLFDTSNKLKAPLDQIELDLQDGRDEHFWSVLDLGASNLQGVVLSNSEFRCLYQLGQRFFGNVKIKNPNFTGLNGTVISFRDLNYWWRGGSQAPNSDVVLLGDITLGESVSPSLLAEYLKSLGVHQSNANLKNVTFHRHCFSISPVLKWLENNKLHLNDCQISGVKLPANSENIVLESITHIDEQLSLYGCALSTAQLQVLYDAGQRQFDGVNFSSVDFSLIDMYEDCSFRSAMFQNVTLSGTHFIRCDFDGTDFRGADLFKAHFDSRSNTSSMLLAGSSMHANQLLAFRNSLFFEGEVTLVRTDAMDGVEESLRKLELAPLSYSVQLQRCVVRLDHFWLSFFQEKELTLSRVVLDDTILADLACMQNLTLSEVNFSQPLLHNALVALLTNPENQRLSFHQSCWDAIDFGSFPGVLLQSLYGYASEQRYRLQLSDAQFQILYDHGVNDFVSFDCHRVNPKLDPGRILHLFRDNMPHAWLFDASQHDAHNEGINFSHVHWYNEDNIRTLPSIAPGKRLKLVASAKDLHEFFKLRRKRHSDTPGALLWHLHGSFDVDDCGPISNLLNHDYSFDLSAVSSVTLTLMAFDIYLQDHKHLPCDFHDLAISLHHSDSDNKTFSGIHFTDRSQAKCCLWQQTDDVTTNHVQKFYSFASCVFDQCQFVGLDLGCRGFIFNIATFTDCVFTDVAFDGVNLESVTIKDCVFSAGCTFLGTTLPAKFFDENSPLTKIQQYQAATKAQRKALQKEGDVIEWAKTMNAEYTTRLNYGFVDILKRLWFVVQCWLWGEAEMALSCMKPGVRESSIAFTDPESFLQQNVTPDNGGTSSILQYGIEPPASDSTPGLYQQTFL